MKKNETNIQEDKTKKILAEYEKANAEFNNHRVWKQLNTTPEQFFKALSQYVDSLQIPKAEWNKCYSDAKKKLAIKVREKNQTYKKPSPFLNRAISI